MLWETPPKNPLGNRPRDAPALRDSMIGSYKPGAVAYRALEMMIATRMRPFFDPVSHIARIIRDELQRSDIYWITPDVCRLVDDARRSLPMGITLTEDILPENVSGCLFFFAESISGESDTPRLLSRRHVPLHVDAVHWYPLLRTDPKGRRHFVVNIDSYVHSERMGMVPLGGCEWAFHDPIGKSNGKRAHSSIIEDRQLLVTLVNLMASPGVLEERRLTPSPNRAARKRQGNVEDVRLIYLRGSSSHDGPGGNRDYHHRWVVSGHWRNQACGPGRTQRRPVWIRPHVKGPEGAPLLTGEKVRVLA